MRSLLFVSIIRCFRIVTSGNLLQSHQLNSSTSNKTNPSGQLCAWGVGEKSTGCRQSTSQIRLHTHTDQEEMPKSKRLRQNFPDTHFTHMHASHTAWLINSNLNDRSLTSYTPAFWWCLEKMLQDPRRAKKTSRVKSMNAKIKMGEVMWLTETHCSCVVAGSLAQSFEGIFATGSQRCWLNWISRC